MSRLTRVKLWRGSDPLLNYRFHVEVNGILFAGFKEVGGLAVDIETEEYHEGGVNDYVHVLPKNTKYSNLVLTHGIAYSAQMFNWIQTVVNGKARKRNGRILLSDIKGNPMWYWTFENAYPVKWKGGDLKSDGNEVFLETLELAHTGIKKVRSLWQILHAVS